MRIRRSTTAAIAATACLETRISDTSLGFAEKASPNVRIIALRRSLATFTFTTLNSLSRPSCSVGSPEPPWTTSGTRLASRTLDKRSKSTRASGAYPCTLPTDTASMSQPTASTKELT